MRALLRILVLLVLLFAALPAKAQTGQRITLTITVTNRAVTSNTLVVNASTRTWTNASTATTIATNLVSTATTATNLYNQIANFPYSSGIFPRWLSETSLALVGPLGGALAASQSGNWAILTLSTQSGPLTFTAIWPMENMAGNATNKTNQGSALVFGLSTYSTNAFATNSTAVSNLVQKGAGPRQHIASEMQFNGGIYGIIGKLTNGYSTNQTLDAPITTNLVNRGNAIRSEGPGLNSFQAGSNALALSANSLAVGNGAVATNQESTAVGINAAATNKAVAIGANAKASTASTAVGYSAQALSANSTAIGGATANVDSGTAVGQGAVAEAASTAVGMTALAQGTNNFTLGAFATTASSVMNAGAIGASASATHSNAIAIGAGASTTASNQIRLGNASQVISIPVALEAANVRNLYAIGTNAINGIFAFTNSLTVASVAPGHNVIDSRTNTILYLTGAPGAAWTLGGFTGDKTDGRELEVWNQTGFDVTIQNESGTAPTASDRILTYATSGGTNATLTGNGLIKFRRSSVQDRWLLIAPCVDVIATGTNGVNSISTNGVSVSSAATALNFVGNNNASVDQATNSSGQVSLQFAPVLFRSTNYGTVYNFGDWDQLMNEEWIANPVSVVGAIGNHPWTTATTGTLPVALANPFIESNTWSHISMVTTQTTSGRILACPSVGAATPTGFVFTNCEYFFEARVRMNSTNLTGDVSTTRIGMSDSVAANGDPATGIYIMNNTNVNTNTFILVTARNSVRTYNYSTLGTYGNMTWQTIGFYFDRTGTNVVAFVGPDRFRFTSFATNNATLPGDFALVGCTIQNDRMASTGGLNFRTNYCDSIKLWVRRFL